MAERGNVGADGVVRTPQGAVAAIKIQPPLSITDYGQARLLQYGGMVCTYLAVEVEGGHRQVIRTLEETIHGLDEALLKRKVQSLWGPEIEEMSEVYIQQKTLSILRKAAANRPTMDEAIIARQALDAIGLDAGLLWRCTKCSHVNYNLSDKCQNGACYQEREKVK